jgi:hypothetical protein
MIVTGRARLRGWASLNLDVGQRRKVALNAKRKSPDMRVKESLAVVVGLACLPRGFFMPAPRRMKFCEDYHRAFPELTEPNQSRQTTICRRPNSGDERGFIHGGESV